MCHSKTDFIAGRVTCATVKPILLLLSLLVTQANKLYCSSRYLCHRLTKCVPRHATCDAFKPILLRYLCHSQNNFIALLATCAIQSSQFCCWSCKRECVTSKRSNYFALISSQWPSHCETNRFIFVHCIVRMSSRRLMKTKSTSYQNWTSRACCLMN